MTQITLRRLPAAAIAVLAAFSTACSSDATSVAATAAAARRVDGPQAPFVGSSVTPALVKTLVSGVETYPIISSDDVLEGSPNFVFGGSADGAGLLRNNDDSFTLLVNHEDNFSVSRIKLDRNFKPVSGEYILNSTNGLYRLCSATLATPQEHGFGPVFITAGENGPESQIHAVDPFGAPNTSRLLTAFGQWSAENAVPLPKQAYPGKTVVVIGDDDFQGSGEFAMYVSDRVGDLENGRLYVMARLDNDRIETNIKVGMKVPVEFREITGQRTLRAGGLNIEAAKLNAISFGRTEDIDYRKPAKRGRAGVSDGEAGRQLYFNVTGQDFVGVNADRSRTKYGRTYKLTLDPSTPLKGSLEVILDGDARTGPAALFQNPDNIVVGTRYAYIQEDPNGYRDETHDAYVYQLDLETNALKPILELDHRRNAPDAAKYNVGSAPSRLGAWEYGAMIDVTKDVGKRLFVDADEDDNVTFLLAIQPHTWRGTRYVNPDGGALRPTENQASQMILVTGLPR